MIWALGFGLSTDPSGDVDLYVCQRQLLDDQRREKNGFDTWRRLPLFSLGCRSRVKGSGLGLRALRLFGVSGVGFKMPALGIQLRPC